MAAVNPLPEEQVRTEPLPEFPEYGNDFGLGNELVNNSYSEYNGEKAYEKMRIYGEENPEASLEEAFNFGVSDIANDFQNGKIDEPTFGEAVTNFGHNFIYRLNKGWQFNDRVVFNGESGNPYLTEEGRILREVEEEFETSITSNYSSSIRREFHSIFSELFFSYTPVIGAGLTGAGIGAGIGAALGSVVPGAGTAAGAILGAKIGGAISAAGTATAMSYLHQMSEIADDATANGWDLDDPRVKNAIRNSAFIALTEGTAAVVFPGVGKFSGGFAKRVVKRAGLGAGVEGTQEATSQILQNVNRIANLEAEKRGLTKATGVGRSFAVGALGGAMMSGSGALIAETRVQSDPKAVEDELNDNEQKQAGKPPATLTPQAEREIRKQAIEAGRKKREEQKKQMAPPERVPKTEKPAAKPKVSPEPPAPKRKVTMQDILNEATEEGIITPIGKKVSEKAKDEKEAEIPDAKKDEDIPIGGEAEKINRIPKLDKEEKKVLKSSVDDVRTTKLVDNTQKPVIEEKQVRKVAKRQKIEDTAKEPAKEIPKKERTKGEERLDEDAEIAPAKPVPEAKLKSTYQKAVNTELGKVSKARKPNLPLFDQATKDSIVQDRLADAENQDNSPSRNIERQNAYKYTPLVYAKQALEKVFFQGFERSDNTLKGFRSFMEKFISTNMNNADAKTLSFLAARYLNRHMKEIAKHIPGNRIVPFTKYLKANLYLWTRKIDHRAFTDFRHILFNEQISADQKMKIADEMLDYMEKLAAQEEKLLHRDSPFSFTPKNRVAADREGRSLPKTRDEFGELAPIDTAETDLVEFVKGLPATSPDMKDVSKSAAKGEIPFNLIPEKGGFRKIRKLIESVGVNIEERLRTLKGEKLKEFVKGMTDSYNIYVNPDLLNHPDRDVAELTIIHEFGHIGIFGLFVNPKTLEFNRKKYVETLTLIFESKDPKVRKRINELLNLYALTEQDPVKVMEEVVLSFIEDLEIREVGATPIFRNFARLLKDWSGVPYSERDIKSFLLEAFKNVPKGLDRPDFFTDNLITPPTPRFLPEKLRGYSRKFRRWLSGQFLENQGLPQGIHRRLERRQSTQEAIITEIRDEIAPLTKKLGKVSKIEVRNALEAYIMRQISGRRLNENQKKILSHLSSARKKDLDRIAKHFRILIDGSTIGHLISIGNSYQALGRANKVAKDPAIVQANQEMIDFAELSLFRILDWVEAWHKRQEENYKNGDYRRKVPGEALETLIKEERAKLEAHFLDIAQKLEEIDAKKGIEGNKVFYSGLLRNINRTFQLASNIGRYHHITYHIFANRPFWRKNIENNEALYEGAVRYVLDNPKFAAEISGDNKPPVNLDQAKALFDSWLVRLKKDFPGTLGGSALLEETGAFISRKSIPKIIRDYLGETSNPAAVVAHTLHRINWATEAQDANVYVMDELIMGGLLSARPTTIATVQIKDVPELSLLAGLYINPDTLYAITSYGVIAPFTRLIRRGEGGRGPFTWTAERLANISGYAKLGKIVYTIEGQVRNATYVLPASMYMGIYGLSPRYWGKASHAAKLIFSGDPKYRAERYDLLRRGVITTGFVRQEIRASTLEHMDPFRAGEIDLKNLSDQVFRGKIHKGKLERAKLAHDRVSGGAMKTFSFSDDFPRVLRWYGALYEGEHILGLKGEKLLKYAEEDAKRGIVTFSRVARLIRSVSSSIPFPDFLSFIWAANLNVYFYNQFKKPMYFMKKGHRAYAVNLFAGAAVAHYGMWIGLQELSKVLFNITDEEEDEYRRITSGKYKLYQRPLFFVGKKDGLPRAIDLSFLNPFVIQTNLGMALMNPSAGGLTKTLMDWARINLWQGFAWDYYDNRLKTGVFMSALLSLWKKQYHFSERTLGERASAFTWGLTPRVVDEALTAGAAILNDNDLTLEERVRNYNEFERNNFWQWQPSSRTYGRGKRVTPGLLAMNMLGLNIDEPFVPSLVRRRSGDFTVTKRKQLAKIKNQFGKVEGEFTDKQKEEMWEIFDVIQFGSQTETGYMEVQDVVRAATDLRDKQNRRVYGNDPNTARVVLPRHNSMSKTEFHLMFEKDPAIFLLPKGYRQKYFFVYDAWYRDREKELGIK